MGTQASPPSLACVILATAPGLDAAAATAQVGYGLYKHGRLRPLWTCAHPVCASGAQFKGAELCAQQMWAAPQWPHFILLSP